MNFANAGIPVTIVEVKQDALDRGLGGHPPQLRAHAARGGIKRRGRRERAWA